MQDELSAALRAFDSANPETYDFRYFVCHAMAKKTLGDYATDLCCCGIPELLRDILQLGGGKNCADPDLRDLLFRTFAPLPLRDPSERRAINVAQVHALANIRHFMQWHKSLLKSNWCFARHHEHAIAVAKL